MALVGAFGPRVARRTQSSKRDSPAGCDAGWTSLMDEPVNLGPCCYSGNMHQCTNGHSLPKGTASRIAVRHPKQKIVSLTMSLLTGGGGCYGGRVGSLAPPTKPVSA